MRKETFNEIDRILGWIFAAIVVGALIFGISKKYFGKKEKNITEKVNEYIEGREKEEKAKAKLTCSWGAGKAKTEKAAELYMEACMEESGYRKW